MSEPAFQTDQQDDDGHPLEDIAERIGTIVDGLAMPVARIDDSFVSVGNMLVECATQLSRVTSAFEELPAELESDALLKATGKLDEVIRHAHEIADGFEAEQVDLEALVKEVDAARAPMASLKKIIQMIGILAINARVVAAGLVGGDDDVDVFTADITELSKSAAGTIARFFKAYEQLSMVVHQAASQRAKFQDAQRDTLKLAAERLSGNLEQIVRHRDQSAANSTETSQVTRDIGMRIGTTVMAMQVGDATRQRIEHIVTALNSIKSLTTGTVPDGIALPALPDVTTLASLLHLERELLEAAHVDFDKGGVDVEQSLTALATDAGAIMSQSRALYGQEDHRGESALGALDTDMRQVAVSLESCDADRRKLDTAATAVGEMVNQLLSRVGAVQDIEGNMRLVTLNAAVKCAQLGPRGKALDVIAKQLRDLTADTVTSAETAMNVLNAAADHARKVIGTDGDQASSRISDLVGDADEAFGLFEQVDKKLSAALSLLDQQGLAANDTLMEAELHFAGHAMISELLSDADVQINALIAELGRPDVKALAADAFGGAFLNYLHQFYTMESERRIHTDMIGIPATGATEDSEESSEDDLDLGLF